MTEAVLATNSDGTVAVIHPSERCIQVLRSGGGLNCAPHAPADGFFRPALQAWLSENADAETLQEIKRTKYLPVPLAQKWEVCKMLRCSSWRSDCPDREQFAEKWIFALTYGGLSREEAVRLIGEFSAPLNAKALETIDVAALPDRSYRNAWRRSSNGGPIWIDENTAQEIDEQRLWAAYGART